MKYGAHIFVWQGQYDDEDLERLLAKAARLDLEFLEVCVGDDICFNASRLGKNAASIGIELILSPGGVWPMDCDISLEDYNLRQKGLDWHKRALDVCAASGAVAYAGAIYGHPGRLAYRRTRPEERERIAEGLRELADHGSANNVRLVIEPMSHFRTHVANTPAEINELIRLTGHPNIYSLLDTYHLTTEVISFDAAISEMMPYLWYVHACENNRGVPGTGLLPWDDIVRTFVREGWGGYIGFESYNSTWQNGMVMCLCIRPRHFSWANLRLTAIQTDAKKPNKVNSEVRIQNNCLDKG
jgi:D-psicose/D-tagatose/L-ribulose 3-epimerase